MFSGLQMEDTSSQIPVRKLYGQERDVTALVNESDVDFEASRHEKKQDLKEDNCSLPKDDKKVSRIFPREVR